MVETYVFCSCMNFASLFLLNNNLLIVGYCHLADGFLYGAEALKKHNYNIYFFPYLSYKMDKIENIEEIFVNFIKTNNIHIILWWNNSIIYE